MRLALLNRTVQNTQSYLGTGWDFEDKKEYIIKFLRIRRRLSERFKTLLLLEHLAVLINS